MNVLLIVIDSLRASSVNSAGRMGSSFAHALQADSISFRRAYATECWTLPTHMSMFTGRLPSEHGAHFQAMAYTQRAATIAELLSSAGYHTEVATRNSVFDGMIPGCVRGFGVNTRVLADASRLDPMPLLLALAKPRLRRSMRQSGFFHAAQRTNREFIQTLARMGIPADRQLLDYALQRLADLRRQQRRYFLFLNLYDVHAPYSPSLRSPLRSFRTSAGWIENLMLPFVLPQVSSHAYLRQGFRMPEAGRRMLLGRYRTAIELMDEKLTAFLNAATSLGLLDNTLLIVTSDHGEAFGEHGLYLHDASVYDTHLHVPLWIRHPDLTPVAVDDVVSTRHLFGLIEKVPRGAELTRSVLDPSWRRANGAALAEHFHYPHTDGLLPQYRQNIGAAIVGHLKVIARRSGLEQYDLLADPHETQPITTTIRDFEALCRRDGGSLDAIASASAHLRRWEYLAVAA